MATKRSDMVTGILMTLMLLENVAIAGLAGYFIWTDRVTGDQVRLVWKVYEGEITDDVLADAKSWQDHKADQARQKAQTPSGADAKAKLAATGVEAEAERLGLLRLLKELQDQRGLVQMQLDEYERKRSDLAAIEKRIDAKLAQQEAGPDASFEAMVGIVKAMKPNKIKEYLAQQDENTVADVLRALGNRLAAKVLAEFKTPAEMELTRKYLDTIRQGELVGGTPTASIATGR